MLKLKVGNINEVLGELDALKLKSSMTMFDFVCPNDIFEKVLIRFFHDERCHKTTVELTNKKLFNDATKNFNFPEYTYSISKIKRF